VDENDPATEKKPAASPAAKAKGVTTGKKPKKAGGEVKAEGKERKPRAPRKPKGEATVKTTVVGAKPAAPPAKPKAKQGKPATGGGGRQRGLAEFIDPDSSSSSSSSYSEDEMAASSIVMDRSPRRRAPVKQKEVVDVKGSDSESDESQESSEFENSD
jgi:hypothetical protein